MFESRLSSRHFTLQGPLSFWPRHSGQELLGHFVGMLPGLVDE
jgi:hypothetical protein